MKCSPLLDVCWGATLLGCIVEHPWAHSNHHSLVWCKCGSIFSHCFVSVSFCAQLLETTTARSVLSSEEELVLLIAAICHDLDHDGFTNSFHIFSQSPLAQMYNDVSGEVG